MNWRYIGAVHPLDHEGDWIKPDEHAPLVFHIIGIVNLKEEGSLLLTKCTVDTTEGWIDWEHISAHVGFYLENFKKAWAAFCYYGAERFGGTTEHFTNKQQVINRLKEYGIEVKRKWQ
ncbi:hypothetical protein Goe25_02130 [Bacillus phage vB_BsuM-Goe25]|nr:hypothetical protein Goe25_02130 [Bacillus phage vB_BsuM-Goe25]